ncbi:iron complex outermembrane receptor protein [Methylobacter tundripaludum]|uniref:Iron complex outermembrane receptor protein n=2 Tax=Methylobacter tundripaludum TaxID=173365 RepID=A0A2S6HCZ0_9GAMM|nr:iron complex outermembrane receptor protein [Methylobacter tundripaludum]
MMHIVINSCRPLVLRGRESHFEEVSAIQGDRKIKTYFFSAFFILMLCHALPGRADVDGNSKVFKFNIPGQNMAASLVAFSETTGNQLSYPAALVKDIKSKPLSGSYTADQALQKLLGGSGITYRHTDNDAIALAVDSSAQSSQSAQATTLKAMTVVGTAKTDDDPTAYKVTNASTATKTDTPIMETPYSVAVVSQQVFQDQQVIRVEDALKNVAGVQPGFSSGGLNETFMTRGFQTTNLYRDGFLLPAGFGASDAGRQTANVERIEVLKGPGSILYGRSDPGGVINLVTKRPQATPYHSIQQQFGSYDRYRTTADSTGAITPDDKLLYRVNLSYENANSFRDFVKTDSVFFAPSLTWNISDRTQANMNIEYNHFDNTIDSGIPVVGNRPAPVSRNLQVADPFNNKNVGDRTYVGFDWSHKFNDEWKFSHRFGAEFFDAAQDFTFFSGRPDAAGNLANAPSALPMGKRGFNNGNSQQQEYYTTLNLTGKFDTAMLKHTMLWGFDYFTIDNQFAGACCQAFPAGATFNIYNPTYLTAAPNIDFTPGPNRNMDWYGLYFQDQIKFPFDVYGNFGLRYDNAVGRDLTAGMVTTRDARVSPRGGLLWKPQEWLSVYGNYSENFGPSNSLFNGPGQQALPPQTSEEWELGAKTEFFNGRLSASFAYFDLTKQNLPVPDPINPNITRTVGEQESRGYEFQATGEILPGWKVIGAYTNLAYAKINKDVDFNGGPGDTGNRMFATPRNFGSLWNTYEFQNAGLRGLKLGGGVVASGQSQGTNQNDYQLPGYTTVNLLASYGLKVAGKKVTFQLNADNLLDKTYYQGTNSSTRVGINPPRTFLGSVKLEF